MSLLFTYDPRRDATVVHRIHYEEINGKRKRCYKSIGSIACKEYNNGFNKSTIALSIKAAPKEKLKANIRSEINRFLKLILNKKYEFSFSKNITSENKNLSSEDWIKINQECSKLNNQYQKTLGEVLFEKTDEGYMESEILTYSNLDHCNTISTSVNVTNAENLIKIIKSKI
jgi:hypothetical protein